MLVHRSTMHPHPHVGQFSAYRLKLWIKTVMNKILGKKQSSSSHWSNLGLFVVKWILNILVSPNQHPLDNKENWIKLILIYWFLKFSFNFWCDLLGENQDLQKGRQTKKIMKLLWHLSLTNLRVLRNLVHSHHHFSWQNLATSVWYLSPIRVLWVVRSHILGIGRI